MTLNTLDVLLAPALAAALISAPVAARDRAPEPPPFDLRALDANRDGKVSVREFDAAMARHAGPGAGDRREPQPGPQHRADQHAGHPPRGADLDRNQDGVISPAEFRRLQPPRRDAPQDQRCDANRPCAGWR